MMVRRSAATVSICLLVVLFLQACAGGSLRPAIGPSREGSTSALVRYAYFSTELNAVGSISDRGLPGGYREFFPDSDAKVVFILAINSVGRDINIHGTLWRPDGIASSRYRWKVNYDSRFQWHYKSKEFAMVDLKPYPGEWKADLFVDGEQVGTYTFWLGDPTTIARLKQEKQRGASVAAQGLPTSTASPTSPSTTATATPPPKPATPPAPAPPPRSPAPAPAEPSKPPPVPATKPPVPPPAGASDTEPPRIVINYPPSEAKVEREQIILLGLVTDNVALDRVQISVNGIRVPMASDAAISARGHPIRVPVTLHPGENVIEIIAVDRAGNVSQAVRTVTRTGGAAPVAVAALTGDRLAVVIGVGQYDDAQIPRLRYAVSDAEAVHRMLIGVAGFKKDNVLLLTDRTERKPTIRNIRWALGTFLSRAAKKGDTVVIFFAGHGAPEVDPRGFERDGLAKYLIPSDADADDLYSTAFPMDELRTIFERIEAERIVAFLDACYSGSAGGRTFAAKSTRGGSVDDLFLDRLTRSKGRAIVTASRPTEVSLELAELGHGLFTYYLVQGMQGAADLNKDGIVTLQELYEYLEQQVTQKSRAVGGNQHPVIKGEMEGVLPLVKLRTR